MQEQAKLYVIEGPTAEDDGSAWSWKDLGDDRFEREQQGPLVVADVRRGRVLALSSGPIVVAAEVAASLRSRFAEQLVFQAVESPGEYEQIVPQAWVNATMTEENTLVMPLRLLRPNAPAAAYRIVQNPAYVVVSEECASELRKWERRLELSEVSVEGSVGSSPR